MFNLRYEKVPVSRLRLNVENRAALILHEAIYALSDALSADKHFSSASRIVTGNLFSKKMMKMDKTDFVYFLRSNQLIIPYQIPSDGWLNEKLLIKRPEKIKFDLTNIDKMWIAAHCGEIGRQILGGMIYETVPSSRGTILIEIENTKIVSGSHFCQDLSVDGTPTYLGGKIKEGTHPEWMVYDADYVF